MQHGRWERRWQTQGSGGGKASEAVKESVSGRYRYRGRAWRGRLNAVPNLGAPIRSPRLSEVPGPVAGAASVRSEAPPGAVLNERTNHGGRRQGSGRAVSGSAPHAPRTGAGGPGRLGRPRRHRAQQPTRPENETALGVGLSLKGYRGRRPWGATGPSFLVGVPALASVGRGVGAAAARGQRPTRPWARQRWTLSSAVLEQPWGAAATLADGC